MADRVQKNAKLLNRVRRIRGQVEDIERAIASGVPRKTLIHQIASCRGTVRGLMVLVVESRIRACIGDSRAELEASEPLLDVLHRCFK
jgi:DNA-binding FrmR family transcriptional regulator